MTNLDSIVKSRAITLPTEVHLVKAVVFPVVVYGCESWTIKKTDHWRTAAFELWCWRRRLRVSWTARRFIQSFLKKWVLNIHWKDWCWSWNSNTLATWCGKLTHLERDWYWESLKVEGEGDDREWDGGMTLLTQWKWVWVNSGSWPWTGRLSCCSPWGRKDMTERMNWSQFNCYQMNCNPPGSSVRVILQARILEWAAISSSKESSLSRDQTRVSHVSCIGSLGLYHVCHLGSPWCHLEQIPLISVAWMKDFSRL